MAEAYDIYGTQVKIGNIIAYSSLASEQLRIAVVVGIYDDEDHIKVIANDSRDYYKIKSKVIKVKVDNILKLNKGQVDPAVAKELDYYGSMYYDNNVRHAEDLAKKGWKLPKPHNPVYYVIGIEGIASQVIDEPKSILKEALDLARMADSVNDVAKFVVCSYYKDEVVRVYDLKRKIKQYNPIEVLACSYAIKAYKKST